MASRSPDPRTSRWLLAGWLAAAFALSALSDPRLLAAAGAAAALAFPRGLLRNLRRVLRSVVPAAALLSGLSFAFLWAVTGERPALEPFVALALRTAIIAFLGLAVLERASLTRALAPWPAAARLLAVTLAQIHALRLLATDSLDGLRSRLPRKPGPSDVVRGAAGTTAALLALSARNSREVSDALRSRGF